MNSEPTPVDFWTAILRGWSGRCPRCGEGTLFGLVPEDEEPLHDLRAVAGALPRRRRPCLLTIFVVGHIVVPLVLLLERWGNEPPLWVHALLWLPLSVALALYLLPHIKGAVIATLWSQRIASPKPSAGGLDSSV
jgi:uncharacterized protein (DUF983 family)